MEERVFGGRAGATATKFFFITLPLRFQAQFGHGYDPFLLSVRLDERPTFLGLLLAMQGRLANKINSVRAMTTAFLLCVVASSRIVLIPVRGTERQCVLLRLLRESTRPQDARASQFHHVTSTRRKGSFTNGGETYARDLRKMTLAVVLHGRTGTKEATVRDVRLRMVEGEVWFR